MTPNGGSLWVQTAGEFDKLKKISVSPPAEVSSWRLARMKEESSGDFPTARSLAERYKLPGKDDAKGAQTDEVDINNAAMTILHRLDQDCQLLGSPDAAEAPPSLAVPLAVESSQRTFTSLLDLSETLVRDFYLPQTELDKKYGAHTELRMYALLVCLRVLRANIVHLIGTSTGALCSCRCLTRAITVIARLERRPYSVRFPQRQLAGCQDRQGIGHADPLQRVAESSDPGAAHLESRQSHRSSRARRSLRVAVGALRTRVPF